MKLIRNTKNLLNNVSKKFFDSVLSFKEIADSTKSAPLAQINALSQQKTLSQLLFYRYASDVDLDDGKVFYL